MFLSFMLYTVFMVMFWFSISLLMDLLFLIFSIMSGSYMVYLWFFGSWFSYLVILSIISGLMVLMSFVIMIKPNLADVIVISKYKSVVLLYVFLIMMIFMVVVPKEVYSVEFFIGSTLNEFVLVNYYSVNPYMNLYLFLISFLLVMLFIVDSIVNIYGGSFIEI